MDINLLQASTAIVGIFIALIGILTTIIIYFSTKNIKRIKCLLSTSLSLIDVKPNITNDIKIYYKDTLINNISMVEVEIINNGNIPIRKNDLVTPITFEFDENAEIIGNDISDRDPSNIKVDLKINGEKNISTCYFDLLNPKDFIKLRFTILGDNIGVPKIHSHIEGIKKLEVENLSYSEKSVFWKVAFGAYIVLTLLCFSVTLFSILIEDSFLVTIIFAILTIFITILTYSIWATELREKKI